MKKTVSVVSFRSFLLLFLSAFIFSCAATVKDIDLKDDRAEDSNFSSSDLRDISKFMSDSIADSRFMKEYAATPKPVMMLSESLQNKTDEHIETRVILEKIRTKMINDGVARFIDDAAMEEALKNLSMQATDLYDNNKASQLGQFLGAKYLVRGAITNMRKRDSNVDINYFNITLTCVDLETLEIRWTDEKEMKRLAKRGKMRY